MLRPDLYVKKKKALVFWPNKKNVKLVLK